MGISVLLNRLEEAIEKSNDIDFKEDFKIERFAPVPVEAILEVENRLGISLPKSYVNFVTNHGIFNIGSFKLWPVNHLNSGLNELGSEVGVKLSEVGVEKCSEEVSGLLGITKQEAMSFNSFVFFATYYHEDHFAFDLRTRNKDTEESQCKLINFHDIVTIAQEPFHTCESDTFEQYIVSFIKKQLRLNYPKSYKSFSFEDL